MIKFLRKLRGLRWVNRWNFHYRHKEENVAEHSFWVAIYTFALCTMMKRGEQYTYQSTMVALLHDAEESITGDLPALVKRYADWKPIIALARTELFSKDMKEVRELHELGDSHDVVHAADLFAALVYAEEELRLGNQEFSRIRAELIGSLDRLALESGEDLTVAVRALLTGFGYDSRDGISKPQEMSHI